MKKPGYDYLMIGYNTSNIFYNLTEAFLFFLSLAIVHIIAVLLYTFGSYKRTEKYKNFKDKFEFNLYFRFF